MKLRSLIPFREQSNVMRPEMGLFGSLHREIDRLFDDFSRGFGSETQRVLNLTPSIDVTETDKTIEITAELPGLERKDVEISLEDDVLIIRGEKKVETKPERDKDGSKNYHVTERSYGMFYRALQLPARVDPSSVEATMSKGILKVTIPKPAQAETKRIEVKEAA